ncbi:hypothetical protein CVE29_09035 [Pseudomonas syringae pv. actinidiae]|nr:hypothetical protein [Pseudomonas syringae pv. actinidiae]
MPGNGSKPTQSASPLLILAEGRGGDRGGDPHLLAKRPVQSLKIGCLNQRLREQCGSPPLSHRSV